MYVATYERQVKCFWNALLHSVYHRLMCYFSYEISNLLLKVAEGKHLDINYKAYSGP